jgi:hypothetical protein
MFALGEAADARAIPAHYQPASVVLEFVNQHGPDGGRATFDGRWGFGETLGKLKYHGRELRRRAHRAAVVALPWEAVSKLPVHEKAARRRLPNSNLMMDQMNLSSGFGLRRYAMKPTSAKPRIINNRTGRCCWQKAIENTILSLLGRSWIVDINKSGNPHMIIELT